jgi:hypothetical protein
MFPAGGCVNGQPAPMAGHRQRVVQVDQPARRLLEAVTNVFRSRSRRVQAVAAQDAPDGPAPGAQPDEHDLGRPQLLQAVQNQEGGGGQVLDDDPRGPGEFPDILDQLPTTSRSRMPGCPNPPTRA